MPQAPPCDACMLSSWRRSPAGMLQDDENCTGPGLMCFQGKSRPCDQPVPQLWVLGTGRLSQCSCLVQATTMGRPALQLPFTLGPVSPSRQVSSRQLGPVRARGLAAAASSRRHSLASGSSRASSDRLDFNSVSEFAPTPSSLSVSRIHSAHSSQPSDTGLDHVRVRQMQLPSADCLHNAPATSLNAQCRRRLPVVRTACRQPYHLWP